MAKLSTFTSKASPVAADYVYLYSVADAGERKSTIAQLLTGQELTNVTLTNPTMSTPTLGVATATSLNGVALSSPGTATMVVANGKTVTLSNSLSLSGTDGTAFAFPGVSGVVVTTEGTQTLTNKTLSFPVISTPAISGTLIQTNSSANALVTGPTGNTNPVFRTVNNIASQATGISITGRAAGAGADITVLSSGTNEDLNIEAKGTGGIHLNATATGIVRVGPSASPAFLITQTGAGTGIGIVSQAAAAGVALAAISSGTNENLTIDAKGSGTVTLNGTATGNIVLGRAATGVSLAVTGALTSSSPSAGIGYVTGAGGAVTQTGSATTAVTLDTICGQITTFNLTLVAYADVSFTLNNSQIDAGDVVVVSTKSYAGTADGIPLASVQATADGSCVINIYNQGAVALDDPVVINFAVIKAVAA